MNKNLEKIEKFRDLMQKDGLEEAGNKEKMELLAKWKEN